MQRSCENCTGRKKAVTRMKSYGPCRVLRTRSGMVEMAAKCDKYEPILPDWKCPDDYEGLLKEAEEKWER